MRNWVRRLISWRSDRPTLRSPKRNAPSGLGFECLEDRLAPAITALPAGGVGLNMPRFPIEEEVRAATNQAWAPLTISVQSPAQGSLFNHNVAVSGVVSIANVGQVSLAVQTDGGGFVPVGLVGSQFSVPTGFALNGTAEGAHTLTFLTTDQAGRSATTAVTIHLDTIAPTIATLDLDTASDTGTPGDQITTAATVTLRGTTEAGSTVVLVNTGASTTADASGVYSFANLALPLGASTFQVRGTDRAGNLGTIFSRTITRQTANVAPVVTINPLVTNATAPTLTGTIDSAATVVVTVNNQNLTATVTGNTWSVNIPGPLAAGTYPITVNATNSANQTGTATNATGLIVDLTAPTLGITSSKTSPTNATSIPLTFTFNEDVANFVVADIAVTNGSIGPLTKVDARTYTATLTPGTAGTVTVTVAANNASDTAGNGIATTTFNITFDNSAPTATISTAVSDPTNNSPITFTIEFSEDVNNFVIGDLTATNGTLGNFVIVDGNTYRVDVTPTANGAVSLSLAAGVAQDAAGNDNTSATFSIASDRTAPTVALTATVASPTNANSFTVTATFSEDVTGVSLADFNVSGGAASAFTIVNDHTYSVLITPSADGVVAISVPINSAQDSAGNGNTAGTLSITVDRVAPTATITPNATNPTNQASFPITIVFSEDAADFTAAGLTVTGGTFAGFTKVDNKTYTATVTPTPNSVVTIDVAAASAHDAAGNANTAATASITSDTIAPTAVISSVISSPTTLTSIPITIQFSEDVLGLVVGDFAVTNGSLTNLVATDNNTYTATLIPGSDGLVSVNLAAGAAHDAAGNNSEAATFSITADIPPAANITSGVTSPTNAASFTITITFTEDVNNFTAAGIDVANGTLSGFASSDNKTYTATVTPAADGLVTVTVLAGAAQDSGNNSNAAATFSITSDTTAPTVSFSSSATNPTNLASIPVTITFSEDVTGFTAAGLLIGGGTLDTFTKTNDHTYTISIIPTADGLVTIDVLTAAAHDAAGNTSIAANTSLTSDRTAPTVAITSATTSPTNANSFTVTITFSEIVADFALADIAVDHGTASDLTTADGKIYTALITPSVDGVVSVTVAAATAHDAAGNANTAGAFALTVDRAAPTATITSSITGPTNQGSILLTIVFNEDVVNLTDAGLTVSGGTLGSVSAVDNRTYHVTLSPTTNGSVTVDLLAASAQDAAGNNNTAASFAIVYDTIAPTAIISSSASDPTTTSPIPITIEFSEDVDDFTAADLVIGNGTIVAFAKTDNNTYTATIAPTADGLVSVDLAADKAHDAAGNGNTVAAFSITADVAPGASISSAFVSPSNAASFSITITFTEDVVNFTGGIDVVNGTVSGLTMIDAKTYTATITPAADGLVTVTVQAGAAQDLGGNNNTASAAYSMTHDATPPTISFSTTASNPTNLASIPITITFDEDVFDFTSAGVLVANGSVDTFTMTDPRTYIVTVLPAGDGLVTLEVLAAAAHDAAGNVSATGNFSLTSDRTGPTVSIGASVANPTNANNFTVTITFNDDVADFALADLAVTNGSASDFVTLDGHTYTALITPSTNGTVTVTVAANQAHDSVGNGNTVGTFSIVSDRAAPTATITSSTTGPTNAATIPITITFDEDVANFTLAGLTATGGTLSDFGTTNDHTYTATLTLSAEGTVSVDLLAASAQDAAGNNNTAATFSIVHDSVGPTAVISSESADPSNLASIPITFEFNENVTNFVAADVSVTNGTLSNFTKVDENTYTATVTPTAEGLVTVSIANAAAQDIAGNDSAASSFSITANFPPVGVVSSTLTSPTNAATIPITITFNEDVFNFALAGLSATNGTLSNLVMTDARNYTVTLTPSADGIATVTLLAGAVQDAGGHSNAVATFSITSDRTAPTLPNPITAFSVPLAAASSSGLLSGTFDDNSVGSSSVTFNITIGTTPMNITLNLLDKAAPITVANFFNYLSRYDDNGGVLFHRLHLEPLLKIIQAGGYTFNDATNTFSSHIPTDNPIFNEYSDAHPNVAGTISMARLGGDANSATSEFFFNFDDVNANTLNATNGGGFAVFGSVASQADLDKMMTLSTFTIKNAGGTFNELPLVDGVTVDENNVLRITSVGVNHRDAALTYSVTSSNEAIVTVASSGFQNNFISLNYHATGTSTITITATDQAGNSTNNTFVVTVT